MNGMMFHHIYSHVEHILHLKFIKNINYQLYFSILCRHNNPSYWICYNANDVKNLVHHAPPGKGDNGLFGLRIGITYGPKLHKQE